MPGDAGGVRADRAGEAGAGRPEALAAVDGSRRPRIDRGGRSVLDRAAESHAAAGKSERTSGTTSDDASGVSHGVTTAATPDTRGRGAKDADGAGLTVEERCGTGPINSSEFRGNRRHFGGPTKRTTTRTTSTGGATAVVWFATCHRHDLCASGDRCVGASTGNARVGKAWR